MDAGCFPCVLFYVGASLAEKQPLLGGLTIGASVLLFAWGMYLESKKEEGA